MKLIPYKFSISGQSDNHPLSDTKSIIQYLFIPLKSLLFYVFCPIFDNIFIKIGDFSKYHFAIENELFPEVQKSRNTKSYPKLEQNESRLQQIEN